MARGRWLSVMLVVAGCSGEGTDQGSGLASGPLDCAAGLVAHGGTCLDPILRYEPADRLDFDNVVAYGELPQHLDLPEPPKSGFRLVVPPVPLEPGEERVRCQAWHYPEITHRNVYSARIYTTTGLHHSNMYGVPVSEENGPSPYPKCAPGQDDIFSRLGRIATDGFPNVLFANSTQVIGDEGYAFPKGMAFKVDVEGREVATNIHWLNPTAEPIVVETVYDFYTLSDAELEQEIVPFVFENQGFEVPPRTEQSVTTECKLFGGNIVAINSHSHERTLEFVVDLIDEAGEPERIYESIGYDLEGDIEIYQEPVALEGKAKIRHSCLIQNDLDKIIDYGLGTDEMCTLFGYMYPPVKQTVGVISEKDGDCFSAQLGLMRE